MSDLQRMQREYEVRKTRTVYANRYSAFNTAGLFIKLQREREILRLLRDTGIDSLKNHKILEIGCGSGSVLVEFLNFGARPRNLYGVDLIQDRVREAHSRLAGSNISCVNGQYVPFPSQSFDMVMQFTALSSILDACIRQDIAGEMLRVLRPDGLILWYDFWTNPINRQTHGIRPDELRAIFPNCRYTFRRITLAPPLARALAPISWVGAMLLESLKVFNSHYLVAIQPDPNRQPAYQPPVV